MKGLPSGAQKLKDKTVITIGSQNFVWLGRKIKKHVWRNLKGSRKDPFLYLGLISIILFGIISFSARPFFDNVNFLVFTQDPQNNERAFVFPGTKIQESPDLSLIQKTSLAAISPPIMVTPQVLGALVGGYEFEDIQKIIVEYIVEPGDNLGSIAEKFNISLETLLWANNLNKNTLIQIGQKLVILPVSGIIHHVKKADTLSQIAKTYKSEVDKIIVFNDLANEDIYIGDILIIPDGVMPPPVRYAPASVPLASSYFICPISQPCRITQGLHWYNAIDFSHGKCSEPVYAAAAGKILRVRLTSSRSRWAFSGAGNHLTILHPNGVVTYYGHVQASLVNPGDYVSQGQMIALVGGAPGTPGAGRSTGCHLHFGVRGARNPFR